MRTFVLACLLLPLAGCTNEVRIAVGRSRDQAVALVEKHGGTDITPGLAVVGENGEWPLKGIYWELRDYDVVITLSAEAGTVTAMTFWTRGDFEHSKSRRAKTERSITAIKLDTKTKRVWIEVTKDAGRPNATADWSAG